ncbi:MAG: DUF2281 domain-containing protein [Methylococcales bacterium]|nr:DUF2281 domain-containing protein [Methylococcales bacterium]
MNTTELIYQESKELPEFEAREVLDFVAFLKAKRQRKLAAEQETADMSEFDQFGSVFDGNFDRDACYDRPHLR